MSPYIKALNIRPKPINYIEKHIDITRCDIGSKGSMPVVKKTDAKFKNVTTSTQEDASLPNKNY